MTSEPSSLARPSPLSVAAWWAATLITLALLDDLTFGPFFWLTARLGQWWMAVALVYVIYVPVQIWLVARGTVDDPGRIADFFLRRLDLERRSAAIADRERSIRQRVVGVGSALLLSLLIGGVLPPLLLWRRGHSRSTVRRLAAVTSVIYATEFAVLHAVVPASI